MILRPGMVVMLLRRRDRATNRLKCAVSVLADKLHRADANGDDQSKHDCVLDSGWPVFGSQERFDFLYEILHRFNSVFWRPPDGWRVNKNGD